MVAPLTQAELDIVPIRPNPHPDGHPWAKCCGTKTDVNCMCLMRKPKNEPSRFRKMLDNLYQFNPFSQNALSQIARRKLLKCVAEKGRFFCIHRMDGEYHRECAGWAAKITGNKP